jgi:hypothetical protein
MPGKKIAKKQIEIYMNNRKKGCTQILASAKADFSERSGRDIDHNKLQPQKGKVRDWKTREDPFEKVWESDVIPMLKQGIIESTFLLEELQKKYPNEFPDSALRTLQRNVKKWRALFGKDKEVMFRQKHEPGVLAISDFTHPNEIKVTINGEPFEHIFYHFRLVYSGFNYMQVFRGSGEPYEAFSQGLQEALISLGGIPKKHRTDSLSASFKNLNKNAQEDLTARYKAFIEHYGMEATRINKGKSHENGAAEASHGHMKKRIDQSLIMRKSIDFSSLDEYRNFIQDVTRQHNKKYTKLIEAERAILLPLPATKAVDYNECVAVVSSTSTIDVRRVTYSVPSRLIGEKLHVRIYSDKLECYLGIMHAMTLERAPIPMRGTRRNQIDFRHVISSLVKKPGAFRGYRLRNELLPNEDYHKIWEHVDRTMHPTDACKFIVGLLSLAATQDCLNELAQEVSDLIKNESQLKLSELQDKFNQHKSTIPDLNIPQHTPGSYNQFIPNYQEAQR